MAIVRDYVFDNLSRIGNDNCGQSQRNIQNLNSSNYMLQNFFAADCNMARPIDFATSQPGVNFTGGFQVGAGGCNIDANSELFNGSILTHPRCRIDLFHRPFATVPYLGRGSVNPIMEAQIQQGESLTNKRSVNNLSEKSYIRYSQTPLLQSVKDKINNPANCVEGVASEGWIRGGVPSRELTRDNDFNKQ